MPGLFFSPILNNIAAHGDNIYPSRPRQADETTRFFFPFWVQKDNGMFYVCCVQRTCFMYLSGRWTLISGPEGEMMS